MAGLPSKPLSTYNKKWPPFQCSIRAFTLQMTSQQRPSVNNSHSFCVPMEVLLLTSWTVKGFQDFFFDLHYPLVYNLFFKANSLAFKLLHLLLFRILSLNVHYAVAYSEIFKGGAWHMKAIIIGLCLHKQYNLWSSQVFLFQYYTKRGGPWAPKHPLWVRYWHYVCLKIKLPNAE